MNEKSAAADREITGPFDSSEVSAVQPFIDLGAIKITPRSGLQLRLDIEEATKRLVAATLEIDGSVLQVQVFAAPRSAGLWNEIRAQVADQVSKQGGSAEHVVWECLDRNFAPRSRPRTVPDARFASSVLTDRGGFSAVSFPVPRQRNPAARPSSRMSFAPSW